MYECGVAVGLNVSQWCFWQCCGDDLSPLLCQQSQVPLVSSVPVTYNQQPTLDTTLPCECDQSRQTDTSTHFILFMNVSWQLLSALIFQLVNIKCVLIRTVLQRIHMASSFLSKQNELHTAHKGPTKIISHFLFLAQTPAWGLDDLNREMV